MERALSSASEVACKSSFVVAIAHSNDLAVDLNKDSVSKGDARSKWKWCAYKTAVTEGRIDASVGIVPHQSEVGRPSNSNPVCPTATMSPFVWSATAKAREKVSPGNGVVTPP